MKESQVKDPELFKYVIPNHELNLTDELLKSISDGIEDVRMEQLEKNTAELISRTLRSKEFVFS